jgi:glycine/serine hydroxymethyltransferase
MKRRARIRGTTRNKQVLRKRFPAGRTVWPGWGFPPGQRRGTDNHLILIDLGSKGLTGGRGPNRPWNGPGITANTSTQSFDRQAAQGHQAGLRIGSSGPEPPAA